MHDQHFRVFKVREEEGFQLPIKLMDQFHKNTFVDANVTTITHFANPANKGLQASPLPKEPDEARGDWHLNWYKLDHPAEPLRRVVAENQFKMPQPRQTFDIREAEFLLVPTQKARRNQPQGLDHYVAYKIVAPPVPRRVPLLVLADQWGTDVHQLFSAEYFCVPVTKRRAGRDQTPTHPDTHLLAYRIDNGGIRPRRVGVTDQFFPRGVTRAVEPCIYLLVPTEKIKWKVIPPPGGSRKGKRMGQASAGTVP